jgi:hypothetical protein
MAEPTSAYTFRDLVAKIAHEHGSAYYASGSGKPLIPADDEYNLQLCKEIVNDGIKMFIADAPRKGWRWMRRIAKIKINNTRVTGTADAADATSLTDATLETTYDSDDDLNDWWIYILTGTGQYSYAQITDYTASGGVITVADWLDQYGNAGGTNPAASSTFAITKYETVGGDIARYPLPEYFGGEVNGRITYTKDSNHSAIIDWVDEAHIRTVKSVTEISGYPRRAAYRPLEPVGPALASTSIKRRWELILDPKPSAEDTLEFPYTLYFDKLDLEAGIADSGSTTTVVDATRTEGDDYFNGWRCEIIAGTGKGSYALVTDYTGSTGTFTVADWLTAAGAAGGTDPAADSVYAVEPANNRHPAGQRFDEAVLAACKYKLDEEDDSDTVRDKEFAEKYTKKALPKAYETDGRGQPRRLGTMNRGYGLIYERTWSDITTDNDVV